jgi:hypothetical protein
VLEAILGVGFLALAFLLTIALIRLALSVADFMDRHDRRDDA